MYSPAGSDSYLRNRIWAKSARLGWRWWPELALLTLLLAGAETSADIVRLAGGGVDTSLEPAAEVRTLMAQRGYKGTSLAIVQFEGPIRSEWVRALDDSGAAIHSYLPRFSYLITLPPEELGLD